MSPFALMLQCAIVGGALIVVFILGIGTAIADHVTKRRRTAVCGWCGGGGCDECEPDRLHYPIESELDERLVDRRGVA
ncbi:hypothetical protein ACWESM_18735 [Nocardia sp. NPDC003999]